jgi:hypothetical protein
MAHRYRSAVTGEYVSREYAKANPKTTVEEKDSPVPEVPSVPPVVPVPRVPKVGRDDAK